MREGNIAWSGDLDYNSRTSPLSRRRMKGGRNEGGCGRLAAPLGCNSSQPPRNTTASARPLSDLQPPTLPTAHGQETESNFLPPRAKINLAAAMLLPPVPLASSPSSPHKRTSTPRPSSIRLYQSDQLDVLNEDGTTKVAIFQQRRNLCF